MGKVYDTFADEYIEEAMDLSAPPQATKSHRIRVGLI